jgi:hypothetical protein
MGYNKVILMCNDSDYRVDEDPAGWWDACKEAFSRFWAGSTTKDFHFNGCFGGWQAVSQEHADVVTVILAGGNHATVLGAVNNGGRHTSEADQIFILKQILRSKGYEVHKRRKSRV